MGFELNHAGGLLQIIDGYLVLGKSSDPVDPSTTDGYLYVGDAGGAAELFFMDDIGSITQITSDGYLATANSLRRVGLFEQSTDPSASPQKGFIYAKDVDGYSELFYLNSAGQLRQLTSQEGTQIGASAGFEPSTGPPAVARGQGSMFAQQGSPIELFWLDDYANVTQLTRQGFVPGPISFDNYASLPPIHDDYSTLFGIDPGDGNVELVWQSNNGSLVKLTQHDFVSGPFCIDPLMEHPAPVAGKGFLYTRNTFGSIELFYMDDYGGFVQLTDSGSVKDAYQAKVSISDVASGFLVDKIVGGRNILIGIDSPAAFETLLVETDVAIKLPEQPGDPFPVIGDGYVYTKDVTGATELFYMDGVGAATQVTTGGSVVLTPHALDEHGPTSLESLNSLLDAKLVDAFVLDSYATGADLATHTSDTANPHSTDIGNLGFGTLAELNATVTNADFVDKGVLDGYATSASLTSHTSDTANPHVTKVGNLGSGTLAEFNAAVTDATFVDKDVLDSYATSASLTSHTDDTTNPHVVTMDQAYDGSGSGAGKTITADSGPVEVAASGGSALKIGGYVTLEETTTPTGEADVGLLYTKDADGYTELFYKDNFDKETAITDDGYLFGVPFTMRGSKILNFDSPIGVPGSMTDIIAVQGADFGDRVLVSVPFAIPDEFILTAHVSSPNIVTVKWTQFSGVPIDPDGYDGYLYRVDVMKD